MTDPGPVHRFLLTAPMGLRMDTWAATAMFTNWIDGRGPEDRQTWLVTCFDAHAHSFLQAARNIGVTVEEIEGAGDDERYVMLVGEPGTGWLATAPVSTRVRGHGLLSEGRPDERRQGDEEDKPSWHRADRWMHEGHGLCQCGASSPLLDTNGARKRWHRQHKSEIRNGDAGAATDA